MGVITIGREFGAGGEQVGHIVADRLGWKFVDRHLVAEVARKLAVSEEFVEKHDERRAGFLDRLLQQLAGADFGSPQDPTIFTPPFHDAAFDPARAVLTLTQEAVRTAAADGNCVIVGRGSTYILRGEPGVLSVFLRAKVESRLRLVKELFNLDDETAGKRIRETDSHRAAWIRETFGHDWSNPAHYDMVLDTGTLGFAGAAEAVIAVASANLIAT